MAPLKSKDRALRNVRGDRMKTDINPTVADELQRLYTRDGALTAETVVAEATDPTSPLHRHFEWNTRTAATQWRLEQARHLIRSCIVTIEQRPIRAFPYVASRGSYTPVADVLRSADLAAELLEQFKREADLFRRRWADHKIVAAHYQQWVNQQTT